MQGYGIFAGVVYDVYYPIVQIYDDNVLRLVEKPGGGSNPYWVYDPVSRSLQLTAITGTGIATRVIQNAGMTGVLTPASPGYRNITLQDLSFVLPSIT